MAIEQSAWNGLKTSIVLPNGRSLAFVDTGGSGPVLLLLHGYSDTSRSYSLMMPGLAGFRLLVPDLAGHGGSTAGERFDIDAFCDDIEHLLDTLDIGRLVVAGHSMGAMIGIALAARPGSRVAALVTISGALRPEFPADGSIARGILALADPIAPFDPFFDDWHACPQPVDSVFLNFARQEAAAMPANVWQAILERFETTDLSAEARQVSMPVLCIAGAHDPLFDAGHRSAMTLAFTGARHIVLEPHGHNPHWEDPARIAALLRDFFQQATRPAAVSSRAG